MSEEEVTTTTFSSSCVVCLIGSCRCGDDELEWEYKEEIFVGVLIDDDEVEVSYSEDPRSITLIMLSATTIAKMDVTTAIQINRLKLFRFGAVVVFDEEEVECFVVVGEVVVLVLATEVLALAASCPWRSS